MRLGCWTHSSGRTTSDTYPQIAQRTFTAITPFDAMRRWSSLLRNIEAGDWIVLFPCGDVHMYRTTKSLSFAPPIAAAIIWPTEATVTSDHCHHSSPSVCPGTHVLHSHLGCIDTSTQSSPPSVIMAGTHTHSPSRLTFQ